MNLTIELTQEEVTVIVRLAERLKAGGAAPVLYELMTVEEVAKMIGCTPKNVILRSTKGGDPLRRARSRISGGRVMFRRSELEHIERGSR